MSPIEGVVILGMHRSGTSLIARLVSLLGMSVCRSDDLLVGRGVNPRGHWESKSMIEFNERLLRSQGGAWFCPPALEPNDVSQMLKASQRDAATALDYAHPSRPFVWKDPRTSVLMPFWSAVLARRVAYVLVVRHPLEVCESLASRNRFQPRLSLALWERYTRQAIVGASGLALMLCTYDSVLEDPVAWSARLAEFLQGLGLRDLRVDEAAIRSFATTDLRHSRKAWRTLRPGAHVSPEQAQLAAFVDRELAERSFVPGPVPMETPETEQMFSEIRDHMRAADPDAPPAVLLPSSLLNAPLAAAEDQGNARPRVSVVLIGHEGWMGDGTLEPISATLPPGSEIVQVGDAESPARPSGDVSVRYVSAASGSSEARRLALGCAEAKGQMVVIFAGGPLRCEDWYQRISRVLGAPKAGGASVILRADTSRGRRRCGRAFVGRDFAIQAATTRATSKLVPVALLPYQFAAFDRELLEAAGGLDGGFASADAAIAELSLRLWRMGFRCLVAADVEAWLEGGEPREGRDAQSLDDRLRIATLHLGARGLGEYLDRVRKLPAYEGAAARLQAGDVAARRVAIDAVCAFPPDRYMRRFSARRMMARSLLARARRALMITGSRWRPRSVGAALGRLARRS